MGRGDTHCYLLPRKEVRFGAHQFWLSSLLPHVTVLADTGSGDAPGWPFPHLGRHRGVHLFLLYFFSLQSDSDYCLFTVQLACELLPLLLGIGL